MLTCNNSLGVVYTVYCFNVVSCLLIVNIKDTDDYTGEERGIRFLCFVVLVEYAILSFVLFYAFGFEMQVAKGTTNSSSWYGSTLSERPSVSFCGFVAMVLKFQDTFDQLDASDSADVEEKLLTASVY